MDIILGSTSPRRKEILEYFSLPFRQVGSDFDEDSIAFNGNPRSYVEKLAQEKGNKLVEKHPESIIITADTTVYATGKIFGKPKDDQEAFEMLSILSGQWHSVFTAITVTTKDKTLSGSEETKVLCNVLTPKEISQAIRKHSLFNKAGAYAIQRSGGLIVQKIDGCYYNVVGFPINTLHTLLITFGIDLWDYIKELE
jgi:septum formation protein